MERIVFIHLNPLSESENKRYHVEELVNYGFHVEYWDISKYIWPEITLPHEISSPIVTKIKYFDEFKKKFLSTDLKRTVFILEIPLLWKTRKLLRLIYKNDCYTIHLELFTSPLRQEDNAIKRTLMQKLKRLFSKQFFIVLENHLKWMILEKYYHFEYSQVFSPNMDKEGLKISINHPDYEEFRRISAEPLVEQPYICFCDECFPMHPDIPRLTPNEKIPDTEKYRNSMKRLFDYLEKKYQMPVVIAAHPAAEYEGTEFGNRKILHGCTGNLMKYSVFVVSHVSDTISFVLLSDKPIVYVTTNGYDSVEHIRNNFKRIAAAADMKIYNIDECRLENINIRKINPERRKYFIYHGLTTPETEEKYNIDILSDFIKDL